MNGTSANLPIGLPPGTILQLAYLRERLSNLRPGQFIEIGPGTGYTTALLLKLGWKGTCYDLDHDTITRLKTRFAEEIAGGRLRVCQADYLGLEPPETQVDLVISVMVMEHMDSSAEGVFFRKSRECLKGNGTMMGIVPGSPQNWGIEDEIAGHYRRYTQEGVSELLKKNGFRPAHLAGLTFPLSNFLLPISNFLVRRAEGNRLKLSFEEKTRLSGRRNVAFKTHFPVVLGLFLNIYSLMPFYLIQKAFRASRRALVIYFEAVRI